jgi:hypothetical protein
MQVPRCLFSPRPFMGEGPGERVSRFALSPTPLRAPALRIAQGAAAGEAVLRFFRVPPRKREREQKQPAYAGYSHDR